MLATLEEGYIRLGSSSVAINALCRLWDQTGDQSYLDDAKRIGEFVLEQQQSTGDFIQARQYPLSTPHPMRDAFSAGQAILAMMNLNQRSEDCRLVQAALRAVKFLDTANYGVQTPSHWMMYALEKVYQFEPNPSLLSYAERIASRMLSNKSYRSLGLSTPIACFTEGLLAYDRLLASASVAPSDSRRTGLLRHVRQNLSALLKYRTKDGAFVEGEKIPMVRIDFIEHAGRAFLAYYAQQADW